MPPEVETHLVNAVLTNGARYYVDHAHPELLDARVRRRPLRVVVFDQAAERILAALDGRGHAAAARRARRSSSTRTTPTARATRYGCHENYLMDRAVPFGRIVTHVMPHFVTRQIFTGAGQGRLRGARRRRPTRCRSSSPSGPTSSRRRSGSRPRSSGRSSTPATSRTATPQKYRRLHVIVGDANLCRGRHLPEGRHDRARAGDDRGRLAAARLRASTRRCGRCARCPTTSTLRRAARAGRRHARSPPSRCSGSCSTGPASTPRSRGLECGGRGGRRARSSRRWEAVLTGARDRPDVAGRPARLGGQVPPDRRLPRAPRPGLGRRPAGRHGPAVPRPAARQVAWPPGSGCERITDRRRGRRAAMTEPPADTRAYFRGKCLQRWADDIVAANWDSLVFDIGRDPLRRVPMMEPTRGTEAHVGTLLDECASLGRAVGRGWARRARSRRSDRMAEREQMKKPAPARSERRGRRRGARDVREGREDQGRARRPPRRDRRRPRDQRRGLREVLRPKGRRVARRAPSGRAARDRAVAADSLRARDPADVPARRRPGPELRRAARGRTGRRAPVVDATDDRLDDHPRHDRRGHPLRRRRGHGRRPAGHRAATCIAHRAIEKVFPADRHSRRGHRRRGRPGHGDGQALPAPARALREGRGRRRSASRARPTSSRPDGAQQPAGGHAGPRSSCRCSPATTCAAAPAASSSTTSPAAATRRRNFAATGSGSLHAGTVIKLGFRDEPRPRRRRSTWPSRALFAGGRRGLGHRRPRPRPGHLPDHGHHHRRRLRAGRDAEIAERFGALVDRLAARESDGRVARDRPTDGEATVMSMPFYVAPEQVMKDRADYARKGIARGRSLVARRLRRRHPDLRREPVDHAAQDQRDLRPHRLRRRRQVQRVRPAAHRRRARRRPQGLLLQPRGRRRPQPGQPVRPDPRPDLHPRDEAAWRSRSSWPRSATSRGARPAVPHPLRRHRHGRGRLHACSAARPRPSPNALEDGVAGRPRRSTDGAPRSRSPRWPAPTARSPPTSSRSPCCAAANGRRAFRRLEGDDLGRPGASGAGGGRRTVELSPDQTVRRHTGDREQR